MFTDKQQAVVTGVDQGKDTQYAAAQFLAAQAGLHGFIYLPRNARLCRN